MNINDSIIELQNTIEHISNKAEIIRDMFDVLPDDRQVECLVENQKKLNDINVLLQEMYVAMSSIEPCTEKVEIKKKEDEIDEKLTKAIFPIYSSLYDKFVDGDEISQTK